jgi:hypothetical protein
MSKLLKVTLLASLISHGAHKSDEEHSHSKERKRRSRTASFTTLYEPRAKKCVKVLAKKIGRK